MIIFKGERLNHEWTRGEIPNTVYGMSPQGWIYHELFAEWLEKLFIKNIPQTRPVILLLDGLSSHFTPETMQEKMKLSCFVYHHMQLTWLNHLTLAFLDT